MTEDSTFTLDLLPGQVYGTEEIKISKIIKQQVLTILGYSVNCTNHNNLLGAIYIVANELNNPDYLMDTNPNINSLSLRTEYDTITAKTSTFVEDCGKTFKMNQDLDHNFTIACYIRTYGGLFTRITSANFPDMLIRIDFKLSSLK